MYSPPNEATIPPAEEAVAQALFRMHVRINAQLAINFRRDFPDFCDFVIHKELLTPYFDPHVQKMVWITFYCLCANCINNVNTQSLQRTLGRSRYYQSSADHLIQWLHQYFADLNTLAQHVLEDEHDVPIVARLTWVADVRSKLEQGLHVPRPPFQGACDQCRAVPGIYN